MPRIPRVRGLSSLQLAVAAAPSSSCGAASRRTSFAAAARALSTTAAVRGKNTDWIRGKLWKGEAPGPEDPYTQRMEQPEESNLPDEAREYRASRRVPRVVQESRLVLPPQRSEAYNEKDLHSIDPTYVPATSIEGLEEIETTKTWWEQPGHWGEESEFKGFGSAVKVEDKAVLEVYLRRATVEALALQESGLLDEWVAKKWPAGEDLTGAVQVTVLDGKATLSGDVAVVTGGLTGEAEDVELADAISAEEARETVNAWDASWKDVVLNDHLKFAIRKRLYQLTGNLVPDAKLGAARTAKHILTLTAKPPKQAKLAAVLERKAELTSLPNVTLHSRRITPIDKEVAVGRWKVIEEELLKRNLPVTGTAGLGRNKEREWLSGRT